MKKLVSAGVVLTLPGRFGSVASATMVPPTPLARKLITGPRIFPIPGAFESGFEPWIVTCTFGLIDTHQYQYTYGPYLSKDAAALDAALLNRVYILGPGPDAGGVLFNHSVRSRCLSKVLVS